jgi:hypothetical protein
MEELGEIGEEDKMQGAMPMREVSVMLCIAKLLFFLSFLGFLHI